MTAASILALVSAIASFILELAKLYSSRQAEQAGENVVKNIELQKSVDQLTTAEKVSNDVAGMSDSAVADGLRKFQRD